MRAPSALRTVRRSSGSKWKRSPAAASTDSSPASTVAASRPKGRRLLHLVLAELLAGVELDQHDAALSVLRVEHGRRARALGRLDLVELPVLHERQFRLGG